MADAAIENTQVHAKAQWGLHIAVFAAVLVLIGFFYWPVISSALNVYWVSPTYSHCYLIVPISAYLGWTRREALAQVRPTLFLPALLLIVPLAFVWFIGHLMAINEAQQFMLVAMAQVAFLTIFGWPVYRVLMFPALFLFFLVPTGEYLVPPLQTFTTDFITTFLSLIGIPFYAEGTIIELANGRYQVEEACAGLRFLIATIALGVLFAHLNYRKWRKIILFIVACFVVPVIGNGFRALGIVLLAHYSDNKIAVGFDHLVYGWGFSVVIMLVLFYFGSRYRDDFPASAPPVQTTPPPSAGAVLLAGILCAGAVCAAPAYAAWREGQPLSIDHAAFAQPNFPGWVTANASGVWEPKFFGADENLSFSLNRNSFAAPPVDVHIYYYGRARDGHTLIESTNKMWREDQWNATSSAKLTTKIGNVSAQMVELQLASPIQRRIVWWTYWARGTFTTSGLKVKLARLEGAFAGEDGSALIAVSVPVESGTEAQARHELAEALAAMTDLPARLERAQAR